MSEEKISFQSNSKNTTIGVLLLHGFTATPRQLEPIKNDLQKNGYIVSTPVLPGHGTTPELLNQTKKEAWIRSAQEAYQLLKQKVDAIVIVGNSFGGNIALTLGGKNDKTLKGIVTFSAPIFLRHSWFIRVHRWLYKFLQKPFYPKSGLHYRLPYNPQTADSYPVVPVRALEELFSFIREITIPSLRNIFVPILILQSNNDPLIDPRSGKYLYRHLGSVKKKLISLPGYIHDFEEQETQNKIIVILKNFIREVTSPSYEATLHEFLLQKFLEYSQKPLLFEKENRKYRGKLGKELSEMIYHFSHSLRKQGLKPHDRVAILAPNGIDWVVSDLAILLSGGIVVPLHTTLSQTLLLAILKDAGVSMIIYDEKLKEKLPEEEITGLKKISSKCIKEIMLHEKISEETFPHISSDDTATIVYTSGTTGTPKGVELSHGNILSNMRSALSQIPVFPEDRFLSFLPLSHIFERTAGYYIPLSQGASIYYAEDPTVTLRENIREVRPTIFVSVPRIFEKIEDSIWSMIEKKSERKKQLFLWAMKQNHGSIQYIFSNYLVFRKIRKIFGGKLRLAISGGAALPSRIAKFFQKIGIIILEGYGLTETSPVVAVNTAKAKRIGSVGHLLPEIKVKLTPEKEILVSGPSVMKGYWHKEAETHEVLDHDHWFHTGDLGHFDQEGFLHIIGRKKEMLVLSTGKNIWPETIEQLLNSDPLIAQSIILGHNQPFIVALIIPEWKKLEKSFEESEERLFQFFQKRVENLLKHLLHHEQIKQFTLLKKEFSQERDELTPTLKLRRSMIGLHYQAQIEKMYTTSLERSP